MKDENESLSWKDYQSILKEELLEWEMDVETGTIIMVDEIDEHDTGRLIKEIMYITKMNPELERLKIILDSPGGSVHAMFGMIDYIQSLDKPVDIEIRGIAMSAAAVLLTSATGKRTISKRSSLMFHEISSFSYGKSKDIKSSNKHLEQLEEWVYLLLEERTNKDRHFWENEMNKDFFLTAEQALELGVVDEII